MPIPTQVTFRNMAPSAALEREIRERADGLESFYPRLIACRVTVELPHRHRRRAPSFHVRVELSLPGEDVVVSREPSLHATLKQVGEAEHRKESETDAVRRYAAVAVHEAFDMARRRLQDAARRQRGDVKAHEAPA